MKKLIPHVIMGLAVVATATSLWMTARPWETPADRAVRLCVSCGMPDVEVITLIDNIRISGMSARAAIKVWEDLHDPSELAEAQTMCGPCVDAIVAAVER